MKKELTLFISWSGEDAAEIAKILQKWLHTVFSDIKVHVTPEDVEAGKRWSSQIAQLLESSDIGVLVYTAHNLDSLWMAFEAGALSKKINSSKVIPLLFDVNITDLKGPLSQFQALKFSYENLLKIVESINSELHEEARKSEDLRNNMEFSWDHLEKEVNVVMTRFQSQEHPKKPNVGEALDNLYSLIKTSPLYSTEFANDISQLVQQVKTTHAGSYLFIDGEKAAFSALIAATMRAKEFIYSTRFFPMPILGNQDDYGEAIYARVVGDHMGSGMDTLRGYTRIISANNRAKLKDIFLYLEKFQGTNFTLYITKKTNSFELVIVDDNEVFVHFYGQGQVINSTLHIVGKEVSAHFLEIYQRLHEHDQINNPIIKIEFKNMKEFDAEDWKKKLTEYFSDVPEISSNM